MNSGRLSYVEQLHRDAALLSELSHYHELESLVGRGRKANLAPLIYEEHGGIETPKWLVLDVFYHKNTPFYWLVRFTEGGPHVVSFSSVAAPPGGWPSCLRIKMDHLPDETHIAHPETIRGVLNNPHALNYSTQRKTKSAKWWSAIHKQLEGEVYANVELGKLYRAIDVGSMIPVFRLKDRLVGLSIK